MATQNSPQAAPFGWADRDLPICLLMLDLASDNTETVSMKTKVLINTLKTED